MRQVGRYGLGAKDTIILTLQIKSFAPSVPINYARYEETSPVLFVLSRVSPTMVAISTRFIPQSQKLNQNQETLFRVQPKGLSPIQAPPKLT